MKVFLLKFIFYIYHYFLILCIYINYVNSLNIEDNHTNYINFFQLNDEYELRDDKSPQPLNFLNKEAELFRDYILSTLIQDETPANPNCLYFLSQFFSNYSLVTLKLLQDSSHSLSKLGSYQDCKYKVYYDDDGKNSTTEENINYTYILFYTAPSTPNPKPTLFSICAPEVTDCEKDDYSVILNSFNYKTELLDTIQIAGVEVYVLNDESKKVNNKFYIGMIVIVFFIFIISCEIFPSIPVFLFKCCFKKKIKNLNKHSKKLKNKNYEVYSTSSISQFEKSFDLKESIGEIYGVESNAGINNDSGLSFLKGLRGICLMLFILGKSLEAVYQYPVKNCDRLYFNTPSLSFLYFFNRFTKSLFLSLSSFSLCYKIICYFDNEIEKTTELKNINIKIDDINPDLINSNLKEEDDTSETKRKKSKKSKNKSSKKINTSTGSKSSENLTTVNLKKTASNSGSSSSLPLSKSKKSFSSGDLSKMPSMSQFNSFITETKFYNKLSLKSFFIFLFRQFYKYILFIAIILFYRYSYYDIVSKTADNPMWEFIKNYFVNKLTSKHMVAMIFLYFPFYTKENKNVDYSPNDIVILEISLFILCSLMLFIIYKTNLRFDIILFFLFVVGIGTKIGAYYIILDMKITIYDDIFYPSMGFINKEWKFIFNNIFYYIPCISIGLFFGLINYAIQKSAQNISEFKDKLYLSIPIKLINFLKKMPFFYSLIFSIFFVVLFIWCGLSYDVLFLSDENLLEDSLAAGFYQDDLINVYYSCDIDALIFFLFLAIIPFNLMGENIFISFLKHEYWNILAKPYYSYMLIIQIVGTNILYRMNTKVELNLKCILFFGIISCIFGIILGAILYTFFEVPFKKLNKFILSEKEDNKIEEDIEEDDEDIQIFDQDEKMPGTQL